MSFHQLDMDDLSFGEGSFLSSGLDPLGKISAPQNLTARSRSGGTFETAITNTQSAAFNVGAPGGQFGGIVSQFMPLAFIGAGLWVVSRALRR